MAKQEQNTMNKKIYSFNDEVKVDVENLYWILKFV